jgi:hypothetical protein
MEQRHYRGGLVGPVLLIGFGLVFLAQNLGWVQPDIWLSLLRMWPLILIAAGIDLLIPRRSVWGTLLSLILILAVFAGGFWLSGVRPGSARAGEADSVSVPLGDASQARIHFSPPVAALEIDALGDSSAVILGTVPRAGYGQVQTESSRSGTTALVDVTASGVYVIPAFGPRDDTWHFGLTSKVPVDLEISTGVGLVGADLTGLNLSALDIEMGVGRVVVTLPAEGSFTANLSGAVGEIEVLIPAGVGVRVQMDAALASMITPTGQTYGPGEHEYTTPNYGSAKHRVELRIAQAVGAVIIRQR